MITNLRFPRLCVLLATSFVAAIASSATAQSWLPSSVFPSWGNAVATRTITINFDGAKSEVANGALLLAAIRALQPGDGLAVGPGRWSIERKLDITTQGTAAKPIRIYAQNPSNKPIITRPDAGQNTVNIGEGRPCSYLILQNLEITGGSYLLRMLTCDNVWIDGCYIHDGEGVGISTQRNCSRIYITRNVVTNPGPGQLGEGMYIGTSSGQYITTYSIVAYNHVFNTRSSRHGDGIELKQGCHHNWIIGNLVHDTPYPCILVYGTGGNDVNVVERNICYGSDNEVMQVQGDAIVRNNVCFNGKAAAFFSNDHAKPAANLSVIGNTFINTGDAVTLGHWSGKPNMVFANNAVYSRSGRSIRFAQITSGVTVAGNVVLGRTENVPNNSGYAVGTGLGDFVGASWDGSKIDVRPTKAGVLDNRGVLAFATAFDVSGQARSLPVDVGAAESAPSLAADRATLIATQGGRQNLVIAAGPTHASAIYLVVGSASGSVPGIGLGAYTLPVQPDAWLVFTTSNANSGILQNTLGLLNSAGAAIAAIALPPLSRSFIGTKFVHSAVLMDGRNFTYVTNTSTLELR